MRSKAVSILGCGWLGLPLAEQLLQAGYVVKGSTTHPDKLIPLREKGITSYVIDLSVDEDLAISFFDTTSLVVTVPPRSKSQQPGVYLSQMKKLVHLILQHPHIKQVIYTSSTSVYPDRPGFAKEENVSMPEQSANAELVEVENLFLSIPHITVTIIRLGGLTGGSRLLVRHFAGKKDLAGGNYPVNLIHQEDAVGVIQFSLEKELSGVYNACSPVHPYKKDFIASWHNDFKCLYQSLKKSKGKKGK